MIKQTPYGITINIKIVPNSSKNDIVIEDGFVKVKIMAQPIEGKANKALIEYLSKLIKVPKTKINIVKGETSKDKTLFIEIGDREKIEMVLKFFTPSVTP